MSMPNVSVIIPTYNQAMFLADAIESAIAQTYQNHEIIVVNDGSTDNTEVVAQRYNDKIRYLYQKNQGLAGARNTGIMAARGEYIALLDSDDIWDPSFLTTMIDLVHTTPGAAVYYCGIRYMNEAKQNLPQSGGLDKYSEKDIYHQILRSNFLIPSTIVINRKVVIAENLFDVSFRRLQDWELWIRLLKSGYQFVGLKDQYLVRYRVHDSNLSVDSVGGQQAARAVIKKHFGTDDGQWKTWSAEKHLAYGGLYRKCLLNAIQRQNNWECGTDLLGKALLSDSSLAADLDLFYELSLGSQPAGYRNSVYLLNLEKNAKNIEALLAELFSVVKDIHIQSIRSIVYGTAYKAIGLVAYNTEYFSLCRKYLWLAVLQQPALLREKWIAASFLKSLLGKNGLSFLRNLRRRRIQSVEA